MNAKRYRKLRQVRDKYSFFRTYGPEDADLGILCWGSSQGAGQGGGAARQRRAAKRSPRSCRSCCTRSRTTSSVDFLREVRDIVIFELSYSAQFYKYLRTFLDLPEGHTYLYKRSGGKNLTVGRGRGQDPEGARDRRPAPGGVGMSTTVRELPSFKPGDYKTDLEARLVPGLRRLRGAQRPLPGDGAAPARALEHGHPVRHRLLVAAARATSNTYGFNGVHGRALTLATGVKVARPELHGHRGRRRRRRARDRRQPLHAHVAPQPRHDLHPDGQRDLRAHQGPGRADHARPATRPSRPSGATPSPPSTPASSRSRSARPGSAAASRATSRSPSS